MTDSDFFDLGAAPKRIGLVRLKVRDLARVTDFYRRVLGLTLLEKEVGTATLGTPTVPLLVLRGDPALAPRDPRSAGLFHTAFLLPGRADLARWLAFARDTGVRIEGASNHIVSEAIYLSDPEGNGIEIYADRPVAEWRGPDGAIRMATERLDAPDLLAATAGRSWQGFPEGGVVGHVHLQVGDSEEAERFYRDVLGFDVASRYPGASFFGSGGYHHQLAGNVWRSRGAARRAEGEAGLESVRIVVRDATERDRIVDRAEGVGAEAMRDSEAVRLRDPWGIRIDLSH